MSETSDVADRTTDDGFYVDPSNNLDIFPGFSGNSAFTTSVYHHFVLTVAPGINSTVAYLDGSAKLSTTTTIMDITSATNTINLFLDNTLGGGQEEYSPGKIALFNVYSGVLDGSQGRNACRRSVRADHSLSTRAF